MASWRVEFAVFAIAALCTSCGVTDPGWTQHSNPSPTAKEIARWRSERGFNEASAEEMAEASRSERRFVKNRASSPDGRLRVVLLPGNRIGDFRHGVSTTSVYQLTDAGGRVLMSAPARVVKKAAGEENIEDTLVAWFSPDGAKVLIYEHLHECNGPPPLAILFYKNADEPEGWSVRFPDISDILNEPYDEGAHAQCRGLLGEEILIRNTCEGVSKIRLDRLKDRHPFPFTIG